MLNPQLMAWAKTLLLAQSMAKGKKVHTNMNALKLLLIVI
jgi:hypothetical protein